jgi:WD40 repeat protein
VTFSPDGRLLVSNGVGKGVKVWNLDAGREILTLKACGGCLGFSPDGRLLASTSWYGTTVWVSEESPEERAERWSAEDQQQADVCEPKGQWFAAAFYLKRLAQQKPHDSDLHARYLNAQGKMGAKPKE